MGLDPFRGVYQVRNRIGVQLQQAQLQKRIKVWELWISGLLSTQSRWTATGCSNDSTNATLGL